MSDLTPRERAEMFLLRLKSPPIPIQARIEVVEALAAEFADAEQRGAERMRDIYKPLMMAADRFVEKVNTGQARSHDSYSAFKQALEAIRALPTDEASP